MMHWAETKSKWNDVNSHRFEETVHQSVRSGRQKQAISGMDAMAQIIQRIKQECGE